MSNVQALGEGMVTAVKNYVTRAFAPLAARLTDLENRPSINIHAQGDLQIDGLDHMSRAVAALDRTLRSPVKPVYDKGGKLLYAQREGGDLHALEARPSMSYQGVWATGGENRPGDVCTHDGSMWHCWTATKSRPATSDAWQMMAKTR